MGLNRGNPGDIAAESHLPSWPYVAEKFYSAGIFRRLCNEVRCEQHGGKQEQVRLGNRRSDIFSPSVARGSLEVYAGAPRVPSWPASALQALRRVLLYDTVVYWLLQEVS